MGVFVNFLLSGSVVSLFFQVLPISLLAGAVFAAARYACIRRNGSHLTWQKELPRLLLVCYVTGLINLVLVPSNLWNDIWYALLTGAPFTYSSAPPFTGGFSLVPTFVRYLTGEFVGHPGEWIKTMLAGNFLMFLPMGVLLPLVFPRLSCSRLWLLPAAIPLAIELLQPLLGRSFDTDDLLLNALGIAAGWGLTAICRGLLRRKK